jgi:hypothetical protein
MDWPDFTPQSGSYDPLATTCDNCGAKLYMSWTVTLDVLDQEDEDEEIDTPMQDAVAQ